MKKTITIIGAGFSSLAAACYLAKYGYDVTVYEKNDQLGGRAKQFEKDGFLFDMGPTWYWMPDVFEKFFAEFGKAPSDYYQLQRLNPAYKVYFGIEDAVDVSGSLEEIYALFEKEEAGSAQHLKDFLKLAKSNYELAVKDLVYRPGISPLELITPKTIFKLNQLFFDIRSLLKKKFNNPRLLKILEFPVLFLGAKPQDTPAMYNFMNWADFGLGTWHPKGGMFEVANGIANLAKELGVKFVLNASISSIEVNEKGLAESITVNGEKKYPNIILSGADYHHTETLMPKKYRQYSEAYWDKKTFAPSALLFYVAFDKKIKNVAHHTLFFDESFDAHAVHIYDEPSWPDKPLFYASFPSISDDAFAPKGKEAATFLIPLAAGLNDTPALREQYLEIILKRLEQLTSQNVKDAILFQKSFCVKDFVETYNSYKGNAYGLANTLLQTAFMRPKIKSSTVKNLFFTGQLTVPGPGVPPALISGKIAADIIFKTQQL